jgi:hypothetical protein
MGILYLQFVAHANNLNYRVCQRQRLHSEISENDNYAAASMAIACNN